MDFKIISAAEIPLGEQARVANAAFANYIAGWTEMDVQALARFLHLQGADLFYSRFIETADGLAGFGYINRASEILRLGGMALIPAARGTGAAGALLEHLFAEARTRGDATMMLEVIQQNPRAVALYRKQGFREVAQLSGWRKLGGVNESSASSLTTSEIATSIALHRPNAGEYPDISWPISRHAIAKVEKTRAFEAGDATVVLSNPEAPAIRVHGLFAPSPGWEELRATLAAVMQRFPGHEFFAPAVWPEEYGREVFAPLGFAREPLSQFLMRRDF